MPPSKRRLVVLVHGWSVRDTNTYGKLPARLKAEGKRDAGLDLDIKQIWLGKYVSFRDEVRVRDLARGFQAALEREVGGELKKGRRFICVTHSTGGPVVREWWKRYVFDKKQASPMSHLIMLAPANFGSALAQLGKKRVSRIKTWIEKVEPGTGVLDWLELGSPESWTLNRAWIEGGDAQIGDEQPFPFVLTGQSIDRKFYDNLNSYTGEMGSDGVVRVAAANLNAAYVRLEQVPEAKRLTSRTVWTLGTTRTIQAPPTAFRIIEGRSHSREDIGILRSIPASGPHPTVSALLRCILVGDKAGYEALRQQFEQETAQVVEDERVEPVKGRLARLLGRDREFRHDPCSMVVFRVTDSGGLPVQDFDLLLTGKEDSPDALPKGFFIDRQRNRRAPNTITYFLNADAMSRASQLGIRVEARPKSGFVHYVIGKRSGTVEMLERAVRPHQTTLVDIQLERIVRGGVFELTQSTRSQNFTNQSEGDPL